MCYEGNSLKYLICAINQRSFSSRHWLVLQRSRFHVPVSPFSFVVSETSDPISSLVTPAAPNPLTCSFVHPRMTWHEMMMIVDGVPNLLGRWQYVLLHNCGNCPARHLRLQPPCHLAHLFSFWHGTLRSESRPTFCGAPRFFRSKRFSIHQNTTMLDHQIKLTDKKNILPGDRT